MIDNSTKYIALVLIVFLSVLTCAIILDHQYKMKRLDLISEGKISIKCEEI